MKKESAINFDQLDMIFVVGDANVRPWSPSMRKVYYLETITINLAHLITYYK
jgi:hypothetical protein